MANIALLYIYADSIDTASTKMIFNDQWDQHEYNAITDCIKMTDTDANAQFVKRKAIELMYKEQQCNYQHCRNIKR